VCCAAAGLLLLLVCLALPASSQQIWPLDVTLTAERVEDMAVGTVTIINPTKQPVEVSRMPGGAEVYRSVCTMQAAFYTTYPACSCGLSSAEATCRTIAVQYL
jgi:hypothetical protein